jgi:hypothetical protein
VDSSTVAITVNRIALTAVPSWINLLLSAGLAAVYGALYLKGKEGTDGLAALSYLLVLSVSAWALLRTPGAPVGQAYLLTIAHLLIHGAIRALPELADKFGVFTPLTGPGPDQAPGTGRPLTNQTEAG